MPCPTRLLVLSLMVVSGRRPQRSLRNICVLISINYTVVLLQVKPKVVMKGKAAKKPDSSDDDSSSEEESSDEEEVSITINAIDAWTDIPISRTQQKHSNSRQHSPPLMKNVRK